MTERKFSEDLKRIYPETHISSQGNQLAMARAVMGGPVAVGTCFLGPPDYSRHFPERLAVACRQLRTRDPWAEDRFSSDPED